MFRLKPKKWQKRLRYWLSLWWWRQCKENIDSLRRLQRDEPQLLLLLKAMREQTGATGCSARVYEALYRLREQKPKLVLECGSGITSALIAYALEQNGGGHLVSLEEIEQFHRKIVTAFPPFLRPYATFIHSGTADEILGKWQGRYYRKRPDETYDFVFVDGPIVPKKPFWFDADYLNVVSGRSGSVPAMLDGRISTLVAWRALLSINSELCESQYTLVEADGLRAST